MNKNLLTTFFSVSILLVLIFASLSLIESHQSQQDRPVQDGGNHQSADVKEVSSVKNEWAGIPIVSSDSGARSELTSTASINALPINIKLLGTSTDSTHRALLESGGQLNEYFRGDFIFDQEIQLQTITNSSVVVRYLTSNFTLPLVGPNLLEVKTSKTELSKNDLLAMSQEEIGTRPLILEHIIALPTQSTQNSNILALPGLNPALFEQIGLQTGDIIKDINGKRLNDPSQLSVLQSMIPQAHTLVFTVERDGRLITLYLDIPSETLRIKQ